MVTSLILIAVMLVMVLTTRRVPGMDRRQDRPSRPRPAGKGGDKLILGPGVKAVERHVRPDGIVVVRLGRDETSTPSGTAWRRLVGFFGWRRGRRSGTPSEPADRSKVVDIGPQRQPQSPELEDFLETRRREIARRNAQQAKRGPDDPLH